MKITVSLIDDFGEVVFLDEGDCVCPGCQYWVTGKLRKKGNFTFTATSKPRHCVLCYFEATWELKYYRPNDSQAALSRLE